MGSSFEMETQLIIAKEINFLTDEKYSELHSDLEIIQKQINQLIKKIRYNQANSL
jgi:four helix bundle protein